MSVVDKLGDTLSVADTNELATYLKLVIHEIRYERYQFAEIDDPRVFACALASASVINPCDISFLTRYCHLLANNRARGVLEHIVSDRVIPAD